MRRWGDPQISDFRMRLSAGRRCRAIRKEDWVSLWHWTLISMRHGAESREQRAESREQRAESREQRA